jgi:LPPG:FO 2-phospho-L-lactate transferase
MKVVALAGGVGGAKMADGLYQALPAEDLTVVVNCGDDFDHLGLRICPDLDTVCYTLAGLANPATGWGRKDETWRVLEQVERLGGPHWFHVGDSDLATHVERTRRLRAGQPLSQITAEFCAAWGVKARVLPMSDAPVPTWVETDELGWLPFQEYFVKYACQPVVRGFEFRGGESARPAPGVLDAIHQADCIIACPSNPWVSIDPILRVPGVLKAMRERSLRVVVSPIVGGKAIKGPAAKMYAELGISPSAEAVARHYKDWCTHFILDQVDANLSEVIAALGMTVFRTNTVMLTPQDRLSLAQQILALCSRSPEKDTAP